MKYFTESSSFYSGRQTGSFVKGYSEYDDTRSLSLHLVVEFSSDVDSAEIIADGFFEVLVKYFDLAEGDSYGKFEEVLKLLNSYGQKVVNKYGFDKNDLHLSVAVFDDNLLLLSACGRAEVFLVRESFVEVISQGLHEDGGLHIFSNVATGELKEDDYFVLSNQRLLRFLEKNEIANVFSSATDIKAIEEILEDRLYGEPIDEFVLHLNKVVPRRETMEEKFSYSTKDTIDLKSATTTLKQILDFQKLGRKLKKTDFSKYAEPFKGLGDSISGGGKSFLNECKKIDLQSLKKEKLLLQLVIVLFFLVMGIVYLSYQNEHKSNIAQQNSILNEVEIMVSTAVSKGGYDKEEASKLFIEAENKVVEVLNSGYLRPRAGEVLDKIYLERDRLDKVRRVKNAKMVLDLTTKDQTASVFSLTGFKDRLYLAGLSKVYEAVEDRLFDPLQLTFGGEEVLFGEPMVNKQTAIYYTSNNRILEVTNKVKKFMNTADGEWKKAVAMGTYGSRVYLLDAVNGKVWKYLRERDKYSAGVSYSDEITLKDPVDIAIDSALYILGAKGKITKLYNGKEVSFVVKNAPFIPFKRPTKIFTTLDELGFIYILDPDLNRVVVLQKTLQFEGANYMCQLVFDDVKEIRDIYATDNNKLFLTDGTRVYKEDVKEACGI